MKTPQYNSQDAAEQGFMLLGLIVAIALIFLTLSIAAPVVARSLRRDREVEAQHRGNQYVRAIQVYYRKFGHYPGSIEQLEKTNNVRYLRQRYIDPMTGKDDWRFIPVGQNQTTVKGFFGEPLAGIATTGLGSAAGMASPGIGQTPASSVLGGAGTGAGGGPSGGAATSGLGGFGGTSATNTSGTVGASATGSTTAAAAGTTGTATGTTGSSGTSSSGLSTPFMGVGLNAPGSSILELNEQTTYATWEFLYDPRIEQLKAKAGLNAGAGSVGAGTLGTTPGGIGSTNTTGTGTSSPTGTPSTPSAPVLGVPVQP